MIDRRVLALFHKQLTKTHAITSDPETAFGNNTRNGRKVREADALSDLPTVCFEPKAVGLISRTCLCERKRSDSAH